MIIHMAGIVHIGFIWLRIGSYECENEPSGSTKYGHFSTSCETAGFSRSCPFHVLG
jgi:hypothetical protein